MKNPLFKRLPRELKSEFGKYLVIFLLLTSTIGLVSGFLVADNSMLLAYNESFEKYHVENGNFRTSSALGEHQKETIEQEGVQLYDLFYVEETLSNGNTMRIFQNRTDVDQVCLMEGAFPQGADEIGVDRMYADNNGLHIGDVIESGDHTWKITGLVALSDYSALFQNNSDSMFDSVKFGVSVVSEEGFAVFGKEKLHYNYAWTYNIQPETEKEEKEVS